MPPPAPALPTARHMQLELHALDSGEIRVSTPQARGWAKCARGPHQLWHAVAEAYRQASLAGQARWRGEVSELDALTEVDDPTEPARLSLPSADELAARRLVSYGKGRIVRPDQASPAQWTPNPDGSWSSPQGRRFTADRVIRPLIYKRAQMGLSITYEQWLAAQEATG